MLEPVTAPPSLLPPAVPQLQTGTCQAVLCTGHLSLYLEPPFLFAGSLCTPSSGEAIFIVPVASCGG